MTTDVAPISDAKLKLCRSAKRPHSIESMARFAKNMPSILARLDAAEAKVSKFSTQLGKVYENLNELRITNSEEILALEVDCDRLAALNAELVEALEECVLILQDGDYGEDHSLREVTVKARALLAKARPQEPAP